MHDVESGPGGDAAGEPTNGQNKSTVAAYAEDNPLLGLGTYCLSSIFLATVSTCHLHIVHSASAAECCAVTTAGGWPQAMCHTRALLLYVLPVAQTTQPSVLTSNLWQRACSHHMHCCSSRSMANLLCCARRSPDHVRFPELRTLHLPRRSTQQGQGCCQM